MEAAVYPMLRKFHCHPTPLQRMSIGSVVAASAFVIAGFVQVNECMRLHKTFFLSALCRQYNDHQSDAGQCAREHLQQYALSSDASWR